MKIVVVELSPRGGMIHYAHQLCNGMAAAGAEPVLVTSRGFEPGRLPRRYRLVPALRTWDPKPPGRRRTGPLATIGRRLRRPFRGLRRYREWLRVPAILDRLRPDVVQLGDLRFAPDAAMVHLLRNRGFLVADVCHNVRSFSPGRDTDAGFRTSRVEAAAYESGYRASDLVFVHYRTNRRRFLATYDVEPGRVAAIPQGNGGIFRQFARDEDAADADDLRALLGLEEGHRVVLIFGTLSRYKGVDVAIRALPEIVRRVPDARLAVVGYPMADFDLEREAGAAHRLGVADATRFHPAYVESRDVAAYMELAEVALFPYREVYQSAAVHLAQTFGLPIVASAVGAMPEVIVDGVSGLLVPPDDPGALAGAVSGLLEDPGRARALGERARHESVTRFSWRRVAECVLVHYREALARRDRRPVASGRSGRRREGPAVLGRATVGVAGGSS